MSKIVDLGQAQRRLEVAARAAKSAKTKRVRAEEVEAAANAELREADDEFKAATKAVLNGIGR